MMDLLEMERVKRSGSMEQRLASLEEQVGSGPGPCVWGMDPVGPLVTLQYGGLENEPSGKTTKMRRWAVIPNWKRHPHRPPENSTEHFPGCAPPHSTAGVHTLGQSEEQTFIPPLASSELSSGLCPGNLGGGCFLRLRLPREGGQQRCD